MENDKVYFGMPFMQADTVNANGNFYPQEVVDKAIRDHLAKKSKQRKEKAIEILKDIENMPANWEDNVEDDYWEDL
jgi:hypothetical protein